MYLSKQQTIFGQDYVPFEAVNNIWTRTCTFPSSKHSLVLFPWYVFLLDTRQLKEFVAVFQCHKFEVVSPEEFKDHPIGGLVRCALFLILLDLMVDLSGGQTSNS